MAVPRSTRTAVSCSPLYDPLKVIGSPTHTLTHTGKGSGGQVGQSSIPASSFLDPKGPESLIHQRFDLPGAVGKDEVPGPNPGSSSMKKFLISSIIDEIRNFFISNSSEFQIVNSW